MAQTVIGFFENNLSAYKAVNGLTTKGIAASQIDISSEDPTGTTGDAGIGDGENGFTRFFKNLFGNNDEADRYAKVSQSGYTLVTVYARSAAEAELAASLLDDFGAIDVDEQAMKSNADNRGDQNWKPDEDRNAPQETTIPKIREEVDINKRSEDKGSVRVRSRIVEKPVEAQIRLREEHVKIDRNPVDRAATESDLQSFQEGEIELTERKEVPVVHKEARVVEEITLHKQIEERNETVHEKVRNTEVDIEKFDKSGDALDEYETFINKSGNTRIEDNWNENNQENNKNRRDGDPLFGV